MFDDDWKNRMNENIKMEKLEAKLERQYERNNDLERQLLINQKEVSKLQRICEDLSKSFRDVCLEEFKEFVRRHYNSADYHDMRKVNEVIQFMVELAHLEQV